MSNTVAVSIRITGAEKATKAIRDLRRELKKIDGLRVRFFVDRFERSEGIATKPLIVDERFVNSALTPSMRLNPTMLAPYINSGRILPDKMQGFIGGIQREIAKQQKQNLSGKKRVITSRKQYLATYQDEFSYFKSPIGKRLNPIITKGIK